MPVVEVLPLRLADSALTAPPGPRGLHAMRALPLWTLWRT